MLWSALSSISRTSLCYLAVLLIKLYQYLLSPPKDLLFGPGCCRFEPSCSAYAMACFKQYGPLKASYLTLRRLLRCQPFYHGNGE